MIVFKKKKDICGLCCVTTLRILSLHIKTFFVDLFTSKYLSNKEAMMIIKHHKLCWLQLLKISHYYSIAIPLFKSSFKTTQVVLHLHDCLIM